MKGLFSFIIIIAILHSISASAAIYSYITESTGSATEAHYTFVIERWDPEDDNTPSPCANWPRCYININHKHFSSGNAGVLESSIANVSGLRTMKEIRAEVMKHMSFPFHSKMTHYGTAGETIQECVGLFYQEINSGMDSGTGALLPGSLCGIAPPPVGACRIVESSIELDYQDIDEASLPNAVKTKTASVTCNKDMDVMIIASGIDSGRVPLRNDKSLEASLYLNNKSGEQGTLIHVAADSSTPFEVKSILNVNGRVAPGPFSGSGSIILTIP